MAILNYFFSFEGRITRLHWWLGNLALTLLSCVGIVAAIFSMAATLPPGLKPENTEAVVAWFTGQAWKFAIPLLPVMVGQISLTVRRYHDRDKSGWWALLGFVPTVIWFAAIGSPLWAIPAFLASMVIPIWQLIELGCLAGTAGSNDFGPDPRENMDDLAAEIAAMDPGYRAPRVAAPAPQAVTRLAAAPPARRGGPPAFGRRA